LEQYGADPQDYDAYAHAVKAAAAAATDVACEAGSLSGSDSNIGSDKDHDENVGEAEADPTLRSDLAELAQQCCLFPTARQTGILERLAKKLPANEDT